MKFISILVSLMISFNLMAAEGRISQLVDEFQYSLTVEWDQKDKEEFENINEKFRSKLVSAIHSEGLTKAELTKILEAKVTNKKMLDDMKLRIMLMSPNPTSEEIFSMFQEMKSEMYSQGASWNGEILFGVGFALVLVTFTAFWIYSVATLNKDSCENKGGTEVTTEQNCGIRSVCVVYGQNYCHEYADQYKCDQVTECVY